MESSAKDKKPRKPAKMALVLLAAAIVASIGIVGYVVYDNTFAHSSAASLTVEVDDEVLLDYIGMFEDGRVFDTSILDVASNDMLYPKSMGFTMRDEAAYTPFQMTAGLYEGEGATIKGFALGVLGLSEGDQTTITVVPGDGYALDEAMLETVSLVETIPATEVMSEDDYNSLFGLGSAEPLNIAPHYKWGWDVVVTSVVAGTVTIKHIPTVGEIVYPFGDPTYEGAPMGWACEVEGYDPGADDGVGEVVVRHLVSQADVYTLEGTTYDGITFLISSLDADAGTFVIHKNNPDTGYNAELAGRTLLFEVSIIYITR
ncbi:MAG: FKBP-type peptidyl-prolyl cis-trans isomerase [Thermoplasmata archaeon]|nr:FKBP-type peptidyl-prolyl cis-trans isomerase [Thermoplasmata archaeon]